MKIKSSVLSCCSALLLCAALTGCQTTTQQVDTRPRFFESASASVILKFNRWDTIHILRPDTREAGFLPILNKSDVERELKNRPLDHNLAVVVLGFMFAPSEEAVYAKQWQELLFAQGFKRMVVLRVGASPTTDGLLVAYDSAIAGRNESAAVPAKVSALAASAGTDAADTSSR